MADSAKDTTWKRFRETVNMSKVVNYPKRQLAQRPSGVIEDTAWRYSLMDWGHDPAKS